MVPPIEQCFKCAYIYVDYLYYLLLGPFASEADFNAMLITAYDKIASVIIRPPGPVEPVLNKRVHRTVFMHGNFRPTNIMVHNGQVVSILD